MSHNAPFIPYAALNYPADKSLEAARKFHEMMEKRRTIREFSDRPVDRKVIEEIILAASTAPSGAHKQPWTFCAVASAEIKTKIREAAENEEYENYHGRMTERWLKDLEPFSTDHIKPFLEIAPWLIVVFKRSYELIDGQKINNYYSNESVGLATGMLLTAIHQAGLCSLTHTPSPMNFLAKVLDRPANEKAFLLIPVGYPTDDIKVPDLTRKGIDEVAVFY